MARTLSPVKTLAPTANNYLYNSAMDFCQRNASTATITGTASYLALDRWQVYTTGSWTSPNSSRGGLIPSNGKTRFVSNNQGTPGATTAELRMQQKIESTYAGDFANQTASFSCLATASQQASQLIIEFWYAGAQDNWTSPVLIATSAAQSINTSTATLVKLEGVSVPSNAINGLMVVIRNTNFAASGVAFSAAQITQCMLNLGATAATWSRAGGSYQADLAGCQRYYEKSWDLDITPGTTGNFNGAWGAGLPSITGGGDRLSGPKFSVIKRSDPTFHAYNPNAGIDAAYSVNDGGNRALSGYVGTGVAGVAQLGATGNTLSSGFSHIAHWTADAEIA